jgi:hypothetical protein
VVNPRISRVCHARTVEVDGGPEARKLMSSNAADLYRIPLPA